MEIKCEICRASLPAIFSLNTPKGKPAFISDKKYPIGFKVYIPKANPADIDHYEVESVEKHDLGWIHYLKENLNF